MAKYRVRRYWETYDTVEVEADSVSEAVDKAHNLSLTEGEGIFESLNSDEENDVEEI